MDSEEKNSGDVTRLLVQLREGRDDAQQMLFGIVLGELRRLAGIQMAGQRRGHTLQTTALVNEAYVKLVRGESVPWEDRNHFFRAAARAMRSVLVDHARARTARKRGGGRARVTFDESSRGAIDPGEEVVAVHEALGLLEDVDPQAVRVVELRYFAGLTLDETARVLEVTDRTVSSTWARAKAWLHRKLNP